MPNFDCPGWTPLDIINALNSLAVGGKIVGAAVVTTGLLKFGIAPVLSAWRKRS